MQHIEMGIVRDDEPRITGYRTIYKLVVVLILRDEIEVVIIVDLHKVLTVLECIENIASNLVAMLPCQYLLIFKHDLCGNAYLKFTGKETSPDIKKGTLARE